MNNRGPAKVRLHRRIGDGEAETGPLATAWHSNKFIVSPLCCAGALQPGASKPPASIRRVRVSVNKGTSDANRRARKMLVVGGAAR